MITNLNMEEYVWDSMSLPYIETMYKRSVNMKLYLIHTGFYDPKIMDVIHSFGIPEMRIKQDAVPGMAIPFFFTPTMTSSEYLKKITTTERYNPKGNYGFEKDIWDNLNETIKNEYRGFQIACAQLCGNSHYKMRGFVTIDTEAEYNTWLSQQAEYLEEEGDDDDW